MSLPDPPGPRPKAGGALTPPETAAGSGFLAGHAVGRDDFPSRGRVGSVRRPFRGQGHVSAGPAGTTARSGECAQINRERCRLWNSGRPRSRPCRPSTPRKSSWCPSVVPWPGPLSLLDPPALQPGARTPPRPTDERASSGTLAGHAVGPNDFPRRGRIASVRRPSRGHCLCLSWTHRPPGLHGIGAVLLQGQRLVAFYSYKMNAAERHYPTGEHELLAVVKSLQHWKYYLERCLKLTVVTDHKPNTFLTTKPAAQLS